MTKLGFTVHFWDMAIYLLSAKVAYANPNLAKCPLPHGALPSFC